MTTWKLVGDRRWELVEHTRSGTIHARVASGGVCACGREIEAGDTAPMSAIESVECGGCRETLMAMEKRPWRMARLETF